MAKKEKKENSRFISVIIDTGDNKDQFVPYIFIFETERLFGEKDEFVVEYKGIRRKAKFIRYVPENETSKNVNYKTVIGHIDEGHDYVPPSKDVVVNEIKPEPVPEQVIEAEMVVPVAKDTIKPKRERKKSVKEDEENPKPIKKKSKPKAEEIVNNDVDFFTNLFGDDDGRN